MREIEDPRFAAASGKAEHAIVRFTGRSDSRVSGTVFEVSAGELADADRYEPAGYERISAMLASGKQEWVYVEKHAADGNRPSRDPGSTRAAGCGGSATVRCFQGRDIGVIAPSPSGSSSVYLGSLRLIE
jgi:hypothetical protein